LIEKKRVTAFFWRAGFPIFLGSLLGVKTTGLGACL
jgi:hypothetical protein